MSDYTINNETLAIISCGNDISLVYEGKEMFVINERPNNIIKKNCLKYGSSFEGRLKSAEIITGSDIAYISFYRDIGVSAGHGLEWDSDGQILSFPIPLSFLHSKGIAPENALIVKVNGDSMAPTLNDNDLVVIDKNFSISLNGVYVIKDNINGLRVKRLDKDKDGNLKVISDNKNYETQIYSAAEMQDETITILGKVTAKIAGV